MFYVPSIGSISIGIIASIITVFIQLALSTSLEPCGLPVMTLPFCLAALAFVVIQGTTSYVISVPLSSMTTPEDHLGEYIFVIGDWLRLPSARYDHTTLTSHHDFVLNLARVRRLSNGFEFLFGAIRSSSYNGSHRRKNWGKSSTNRMSTALSDYGESSRALNWEIYNFY